MHQFMSVLAKTLVAGFFLVGCSQLIAQPAHLPDQARIGPNVLEITAKHHSLEGPGEVASGWTTIRLNNASGLVHFAVLERLPIDSNGNQITVEDTQREVAPVFQNFMDSFNGVPLSAPDAGFALPPWFGDIVFLGGPGFIAPGRTAETTVYLEPGTYMLECYVKTNGRFHSFNPDFDPANPDPADYGMVMELTVTEKVARAKEPKATIEITVSSTSGIEVADDIRPGKHTVGVFFAEQILYEHFLGHDVHLARLDADTDLFALSEYMNWTLPEGLETPAPVAFLGGTHEMPAGRTAYFDVLLTPGTYVWIAEVPFALERNMLKTFTVGPEATAD
jgi:hypothetical protein